MEAYLRFRQIDTDIRRQRKMGHITLVGREASELKTKLGAIVGGSVLNGTARAVRKVDFELCADNKQSGHSRPLFTS
jgi:hypothetical protein